MKRIEITALGGPYDGVHISDFDMDFGLSPPNRFVVLVHKAFNQTGEDSIVHIHSALFTAGRETNRKSPGQVNSDLTNNTPKPGLPHQYWIESAKETPDQLTIRALYLGERG